MYFFTLGYVKNQFDSPKNDFLIKILNYLYDVHRRSVLKHLIFKKCVKNTKKLPTSFMDGPLLVLFKKFYSHS